MQLSGASDEHIKKTKSRLIRISEDLCYRCNLNDIIIYINKLKREFAPATYRKYVLDLKRILKEIRAPFVEDLKLPNVPKRSKIVIRPQHLRKLIEQAKKLSESKYFRLKSAILLCSTSGLRSVELYKLKLDDIDIENRTIYVRAEIAKDYEDRVTFFSKEAQEALQGYIPMAKSTPFVKDTLVKDFRKLNVKSGRIVLRMKHMRKFFSQQSDRLGMPTAAKKLLMGHSLNQDIDLQHYDYQDEEELKKIYDRYWKDFRILDCFDLRSSLQGMRGG